MTDKTSLAGKYAIVTGSTQGLGEAIARLFVERGAYHLRAKMSFNTNITMLETIGLKTQKQGCRLAAFSNWKRSPRLLHLSPLMSQV